MTHGVFLPCFMPLLPHKRASENGYGRDDGRSLLKRETCQKEKFSNVLRPYTPETATAMLEKNGFELVKIFNKWHREEDLDPCEYVVLARKP